MFIVLVHRNINMRYFIQMISENTAAKMGKTEFSKDSHANTSAFVVSDSLVRSERNHIHPISLCPFLPASSIRNGNIAGATSAYP